MRSDPTSTEARFFEAVRGARLGVRFKRQVVIGRYIVDFLVPSLALVVEIDGGYHKTRVPQDARRDSYLVARGFFLLRLSDELVRKDLPQALEIVWEALRARGAAPP